MINLFLLIEELGVHAEVDFFKVGFSFVPFGEDGVLVL